MGDTPRRDDPDAMIYRIPGRDYDRGDVTHKQVGQMNRQERRAMRARWREAGKRGINRRV